MSILRNSLTNFSGGVLPAVVLVVTVPLLVAGLGLSNYGLLTLIGAITGYFSIIDINLTAGSIKFVSEYRALGDTKRESQTIILGLFFYLVLGLLGAAELFGKALRHGVTPWVDGFSFAPAPMLRVRTQANSKSSIRPGLVLCLIEEQKYFQQYQ